MPGLAHSLVRQAPRVKKLPSPQSARGAGADAGALGALAGAGGLYLETETPNGRERLSDTAWRRHQMPAYHLVAPGRNGITTRPVSQKMIANSSP